MNANLSFASFVESGYPSDLRVSFPDQFEGDERPGRVYAAEADHAAHDGLYLLQAEDGKFCFEFGLAELTGTLAECEAALYAVYLDEVATEETRAAYLSTAPANRYWKTTK